MLSPAHTGTLALVSEHSGNLCALVSYQRVTNGCHNVGMDYDYVSPGEKDRQAMPWSIQRQCSCRELRSLLDQLASAEDENEYYNVLAGAHWNRTTVPA